MSPILMDMTVVPSLHKFSLEATIDHHDHLCILIIILHLSTVTKTFYCKDNKITEFKIIDTKNSSTAYLVMHKLIT